MEKPLKCPVYKCEESFIKEGPMSANILLHRHYRDKHEDLMNLGLSLGLDPESGEIKGAVKDNLLTQLICFILTNKNQVKRFSMDYEEEELQ